MIYKNFVAEAAEKIMAAVIASKVIAEEDLEQCALDSVRAAKALADALEEDWQDTPVDDFHRFSDKEEFFDNYVNWTQNR